MSAPDMWCGNCGAHFSKCSCGVSAREVFTERPTYEQFEAICSKRFPSSKAMCSGAHWRKHVERYVADIENACVVHGDSLAVGRPAEHDMVFKNFVKPTLNEIANAYLDVGKRATAFGVIQTVEGEALCVFITEAGIELVTATGKTATLERKSAQQLAKTLMEAATFRRASDI